MRLRNWRWRVSIVLAVLLAGCSGAPRRAPTGQIANPIPGVPPPPVDANAIPDAIPRVEPRSRFGNPASYVVFGQHYVVLASAEGYVARGTASWYGPGFHGERTSSGEPYDMYGMTAAHKTLPIPVYARVTNLNNGRSVVVRINDRGPFVGDRLIDLSWSAAARLDMLRTGTAPVEVRVVTPGKADSAGTPPTLAPPTVAPSTVAPPAVVPPAVVPPTVASSTVAPPAVVPPAVAPPELGAGSYLQAGSFSDITNARKLLQRLADNGIHNAQLVAGDSNGRTVWRVRVGPLASREELDDYVERLNLIGIADARLAPD